MNTYAEKLRFDTEQKIKKDQEKRATELRALHARQVNETKQYMDNLKEEKWKEDTEKLARLGQNTAVFSFWPDRYSNSFYREVREYFEAQGFKISFHEQHYHPHTDESYTPYTEYWYEISW